MKIDKEFLNEQMVTFEKQKAEITANLNATLGAIELCEHLQNVLKMKQPPKEKVHDLKDLLPPGAKIVDRTSNEKEKKHGMAKGKKAGKPKRTGGKKGPR